MGAACFTALNTVEWIGETQTLNVRKGGRGRLGAGTVETDQGEADLIVCGCNACRCAALRSLYPGSRKGRIRAHTREHAHAKEGGSG